MLKYLVIFPFLLLTVQAAGTFSVLEHPNSLLFKGNDRLDSNYIGDVLGASLGLYIDADTKWSGLFIDNPFEFPKGVINVMVEGVKGINLSQKAKTFPLTGGDSIDSLNTISSTVEALNSPTINVDLNRGLDSLLTYTDVLGNLQIPTTAKYVGNLKPETYPEDKLFLQQIAAIKALSNKLSDIQNKPTLINIRLSLKSIIEAHGPKSPAVAEALKLISKTVEDFSEKSNKAYGGQLLFTVTTDDSAEVSSRQKRQTQKANDFKKELNLAEYYKEDYPVIFNIILWFMVVFVFALLAISYVIGTMDPGRDSIIYRMTSTRMKKDN
ncbi:ATPase H(+)-transporting accessory protein 2 [Condylostylus longicornis]|uniref:ATPase H(+)-transporting accessory protein 2 n=1 Tax=Condylostylus longicornis TaxID=2530218 RepID=UPI00244E5705|nr:ATPase H(+)-transporting accessory protein 2 [Condylostylus longicornis]